MTNPFEYINAITLSKKNLMRGSENDALAEKEYNAWLANNGLSYFPDTILYANQMNMNHHLDNRPQFEYLINSIRSKKRFSKWAKKVDNEELDLVCAIYQCNRNVGKEYLSLLTSEQLNAMKQEQETGGIKNGHIKQSRGGKSSD